jgi:hypothetical protein
MLAALINNLFYSVKPLIPRSAQLDIRRVIARRKRRKYSRVWPIREDAAVRPADWKGWPEGKQFAFILHHDVESLHGHDQCYRLMDLEEKLGVRSTYFIVPERYPVSDHLISTIKARGFGLGVHGLRHDGKLFQSYEKFKTDAARINGYLHAWESRGFSSPSMIRRHAWMHLLDIEHSTSAFDTDPFEPEPEGVNTIFPFIVRAEPPKRSFVEMPYTLPQDHTLYIILKEKTNDIWKAKLDWIARHNGMALFNTHPDYINFDECRPDSVEEYPVRFFRDFVEHVQKNYAGRYWNPLSRDIPAFVRGFKEVRP